MFRSDRGKLRTRVSGTNSARTSPRMGLEPCLATGAYSLSRLETRGTSNCQPSQARLKPWSSSSASPNSGEVVSSREEVARLNMPSIPLRPRLQTS